MSAPPLQGVRVLDFTRVIAGPYLTMTLADMGADVIKVEPPQGDDSRAYQPPGLGGEAATYLGLNRNKRSIVLDLTQAASRDIVRDLVRETDILVENFRPGAMERMGLGWDDLRLVNPGLIYCAVSGYGRGTPFSAFGGYDPIAQAETGLMHLTGHPDAPPVRAGGSVVDVLAGMHAGMAVLGALRAREAGGPGQMVDVALFDVAMSSIGFILQGSLLTDQDPPRTGNISFFMCPNGVYPCQDGDVMMSAGNDRLFGKLCRELGLEDLPADPRFSSNAARLRNIEDLTARLESRFRSAPREYWVSKLREAGVPCGAVRRPLEALASQEAAARGMVQDVDHPRIGAYRTVGSPLRMSATPVRPIARPPGLGEHTDDILAQLAQARRNERAEPCKG